MCINRQIHFTYNHNHSNFYEGVSAVVGHWCGCTVPEPLQDIFHRRHTSLRFLTLRTEPLSPNMPLGSLMPWLGLYISELCQWQHPAFSWCSHSWRTAGLFWASCCILSHCSQNPQTDQKWKHLHIHPLRHRLRPIQYTLTGAWSQPGNWRRNQK